MKSRFRFLFCAVIALLALSSARAQVSPVVNITSPTSGSILTVNVPVNIAATASDSDGTIVSVQFFASGVSISTVNAFPYNVSWTPSSAGNYSLTAIATDSGGNRTTSAAVAAVVSVGSAPTVALVSPGSGLNVVVGAAVNLSATASDADGTVVNVLFLVNGVALATVNSSPFSAVLNPSAPGVYTIIARATDNVGNVTDSLPQTITVRPNRPPSVTIISPSNGASVTVGSGVTIRASATDPDDLIDTVKFLVNGQVLFTANTFPYTAPWTPTSEGVYTISVIVKDSLGSVGGNETASSPVYVRVVAPAGSAGVGGTAPDAIYTGSYFSGGESGKFAMINLAGKSGVFIAFSSAGTPKTYFYPGLVIDGSGRFSKTDSSGKALVSGVASDSGSSGNLDGNRLTFIGPITFAAGTASIPVGYYTGNIVGKLDSTAVAIVGLDGSITVFVANGSYVDAGSGSLASTGTFSFTTAGGNLLTGKVDAATGLFTGTLAGSNGGAISGALASGGAFSDGALRNLSTRGQVGIGANVLIAGFVVSGTVPKQVLIRAVGPSLTQFGITGALADPQLSVFQGSTAIATNDNWGGSSPLVNAAAQAGAFALDPASKDAVVLITLTPGAYTAQVSGVAGTTGVALIELYDRDSASPFSPEKVMNVATRGVVSSGQGALIAGFVINGTVSKKLLIRAVGPGLTTLGVTGALADPILRVIRSDNVVVRENDNWESGNDAALIADASSKTGAFALASGSKDAVLLFNVPPGTYTALVTGANGTGGVALVEVYEVP